MLALPSLVILLAVIGAFGVRVYLVMALLGVLVAPAVYRVLLGLAQSLHQRLHVDAARVDGVGTVGLNVRHVLPGMATVIAVQASQLFAVSILVQSGLAFMGFGPADPAPSWGGMIAVASQYVYNDPWMMVPTGAVLAITVVAANLVADALLFRQARGAAGASLTRFRQMQRVRPPRCTRHSATRVPSPGPCWRPVG